MADKYWCDNGNKVLLEIYISRISGQLKRLELLENRKKHEAMLLKKIYKIARREAKHDLLQYIQDNKSEFEDDLEIPLYYPELKECKTLKEIHNYMKSFGWKDKQILRTTNGDIVHLNY